MKDKLISPVLKWAGGKRKLLNYLIHLLPNKSGEFNTPFGNYRKPNIINASILRDVSYYLNTAKVFLTALDYSETLKKLTKDSFVYFDPPYDPISGTASFTGYSRSGFSRTDQITLRRACDELTTRGIKFMLSNSATDFIKNQYANYNIIFVKAKRAINCNPLKRGEVDEIIVRNYE